MRNCNNSNRSFAHVIISVVIGFFIFAMLAVVVYDRYKFHWLVNEIASNEIIIIKEKQKQSIIDSLKESNFSTNFIISTTHKKNDQVDNLSDLLQKNDSLLSANGLTYLVTLIVALLASFLINKLDRMEEAIKVAKASNEKMEEAIKVAKASNEKMEEAIKLAKESKKGIEESKKVAMELQEKIYRLRGVLSESLNNIEILENRTELYYKHITIFDYTLNQIASIFNLSIMISNATATFSPSKSDEENKNIATEVGGSLCSLLDLIYDNNIKDSIIDYLTTEEKDIIFTYLDDAQSALNRSKGKANISNQKELTNYIDKNIKSIKNIKEMIDKVKIQDENIA